MKENYSQWINPDWYFLKSTIWKKTHTEGGGGEGYNNLVKCVLCWEKLFCGCVSKYITLVESKLRISENYGYSFRFKRKQPLHNITVYFLLHYLLVSGKIGTTGSDECHLYPSPPPPQQGWCVLFIARQRFKANKLKGNVIVCSCYGKLATTRESPLAYLRAFAYRPNQRLQKPVPHWAFGKSQWYYVLYLDVWRNEARVLW